MAPPEEEVHEEEVHEEEVPEDEEADTNWIEQMTEEENKYNDFYKEPVAAINVFLLYVNQKNELEHLGREKCFLQANNVLSRDMVLSFIKRYQYQGEEKYKVLSLLRYNIDLEPTELLDFINEKEEEAEDRFFTSEKYLKDIRYTDTIHLFQDLNALFFIFYKEKMKLKQDETRRVRLHHSAAPLLPSLNKTRRINEKKKKNLKIIKELTTRV